MAVKQAPDAAVLDLLMPEMSGLELLTAIRQDPAYLTTPAIFLSGRVQLDDVTAGRAMGATYLTKPVILSALANAIEDALEPTATARGVW